MHVDAWVEHDIATISVVGEVDVASSDKLRDMGLAALTDDVTKFRIDLAHCTFMDSAGLGALVLIRNHAQALGLTLALDNVPDRIRKIMEITVLAPIFGIQVNATAAEFAPPMTQRQAE